MIKKKTLPKNFDKIIKEGDISALKEVFIKCELDARGGYSKSTALSFYDIPKELVRWLVEQGADINAKDTYGKTPLHEHAGSWCGNTELLLDLGADKEAIDCQNETPLFAAAGSFKPQAVLTLVTKGVNINAENKRKQTPLAKALMQCSNADIVDMAEIAAILLNAGTTVTQDMKDSVMRIGEEFEFHRESFNKEDLSKTDMALFLLYELFDVVPVNKRKMYDGTYLITVTAKGWQAQHKELWNLLIPSNGHAKTVQGEVIRITGKVSYEILDNGSANWDKQYRMMLDALLNYFNLGTPLDSAVLQDAAALVKELYSGNNSDKPARLCELAVNWVLRNPNPITLEQPAYKR